MTRARFAFDWPSKIVVKSRSRSARDASQSSSLLGGRYTKQIRSLSELFSPTCSQSSLLVPRFGMVRTGRDVFHMAATLAKLVPPDQRHSELRPSEIGGAQPGGSLAPVRPMMSMCRDFIALMTPVLSFIIGSRRKSFPEISVQPMTPGHPHANLIFSVASGAAGSLCALLRH